MVQPFKHTALVEQILLSLAAQLCKIKGTSNTTAAFVLIVYDLILVSFSCSFFLPFCMDGFFQIYIQNVPWCSVHSSSKQWETKTDHNFHCLEGSCLLSYLLLLNKFNNQLVGFYFPTHTIFVYNFLNVLACKIVTQMWVVSRVAGFKGRIQKLTDLCHHWQSTKQTESYMNQKGQKVQPGRVVML